VGENSPALANHPPIPGILPNGSVDQFSPSMAGRVTCDVSFTALAFMMKH